MASIVKKILKVIELPESERTVTNRWVNDDVLPVPPARRTWGK